MFLLADDRARIALLINCNRHSDKITKLYNEQHYFSDPFCLLHLRPLSGNEQMVKSIYQISKTGFDT